MKPVLSGEREPVPDRKPEVLEMGLARFPTIVILTAWLAGSIATGAEHRHRSFLPHGPTAWDVAFTPGGDRLLSVGKEGSMVVWDLQQGRPLTKLIGPAGDLYAVAVAPDGRTAAIGGNTDDFAVRIWDLATAQTLGRLEGHEGSIIQVRYSPDGRWLASADYVGTVKVWDPKSMQERWSLRCGSRTDAIAFLPDSSALLTGSHDQTLRLWDLRTGTVTTTRQFHTDVIRALATSPDGRLAASGSFDDSVRLWRLPELAPVETVSYGADVYSLDFAPDGRTLAVSGDGGIQLVQATTGAVHSRVEDAGLLTRVSSVRFSPDGRALAMAGHDGRVQLLDITDDRFVVTTPRRRLSVGDRPLHAVRFAAGDRLVVAGGDAGQVQIWDAARGQHLGNLAHTRPIWALGTSPDRRFVFSSGQDLLTIAWDTSTQGTQRYQKLHTDTILSLASTPDGATLATGSYDRSIRLWSRKSLQLSAQIAELKGHGSPVNELAVARDGSRLASGDRSGVAKVWDLGTRRELMTRSPGGGGGINALAFTPGGDRLLVGVRDGSIWAWDQTTGAMTRWNEGDVGGTVRALALSPDGSLLAVGSYERRIELWDLAARELIVRAYAHPGGIFGVDFSSDGATLATTGADGAVCLWDVAALRGRAMPRTPEMPSEDGVRPPAARPHLARSAPSLTEVGFLERLRASAPAEWARLSGEAAAAQADALIREALALEGQGRWRDTATLRERMVALRLRAGGLEHVKTAEDLQRLVIPYLRLGRRDEALLAAELSTRLQIQLYKIDLENPGDKARIPVGMALADAGYVHLSAGDLVRAGKYFEGSRRIFRAKLEYFDKIDREEEDRGPADIRMSHWDAMRQLHAMGIRQEWPTEAAEGFISASGGISSYYASIGRSEEAEAVLKEALDAGARWLDADHEQLALAQNELGFFYLNRGRVDQAEPHFREAIRIFSTVKSPSINMKSIQATALHNLGVSLYRKREYEEAERDYLQSMRLYEAEYGPDSPQVAMVLASLGVLESDRGRHDEAADHLDRSLRIHRDTYRSGHPELAMVLISRAHHHAKQGQHTQAFKLADEAIRMIHDYATRSVVGMSDTEQQQFFATTALPRLESALAAVHDGQDEPAIAAGTAAWLTNIKALPLRVRAQRALLSRDADSTNAGSLARELLAVRRELGNLAVAMQNNDQAERAAQYTEALKRERALSQQLSETIPAARISWIETDELRSHIPAGAVLIDYTAHSLTDVHPDAKRGEIVRAWVVPAAGAGEVRSIDVGDGVPGHDAVTKLRQAVQGAQRDLALRGEKQAAADFQEKLAAVSKHLLRPIEEHVAGASRWIICPESDMWLIPWSALPLEDGSFAVEKHEIQLVQSGRDLVEPPTGTADGPPVLVADPDFDASSDDGPAGTNAVAQADEKPADDPDGAAAPAASAPVPVDSDSLAGLASRSRDVLPTGAGTEANSEPGRGRAAWATRWARLPGAGAEAEATAPRLRTLTGLDPVVLRGAEATETAVLQRAHPPLLAFITHAYFLPQKPGDLRSTPLARCGLVLAGANRHAESDATRDADSEDGILTGLDILAIDLRGTRLVVLSACETGLGDASIGQGVEGLLTSLRLAGARSVVSTLWRISDQETVTLMGDFWTAMSAADDPIRALRRAQVDLIARRREARGAAHPYFWAGFIVSGHYGESNGKP